ncbi:SDR family oxidoreductase [Nocardioides sp. AE5]|uniref:SDR family NAD(P)-dependent oxidoreductase n=1 Tax=Nocardioides sp. AE5 TaxID=2962573 RepID=UPI002882661C|nr:SDR family oxidoreductase [Nocardioides sp. AE5]MDT0203192.1 SDR family oxidoreductase [Nocardioides sp. AE5]
MTVEAGDGMAQLAVPIDRSRPYVVTGAGSGIGQAVTELLLQLDAEVVTVDLAASSPAPQDRHVSGNVAETATWQRVVDLVGRLSDDGAAGLITCAGAIVVRDLATTPPEDFERLFRVNALGVLHGIQRLVPAMAERRDGSVVAVASVDSLFAEDRMSAYATSKGALLQMIRSAAVEHARHGVRINAVCPGAIDTPLLRQHLNESSNPDAARRRLEGVTPAGRLLSPLEIAHLLIFLGSPLASAISGAAIVADGGLTSTYDFRLED